MIQHLSKRNSSLKGYKGLPHHYPKPDLENDTMFYIQRNQNLNTVIYKLNKTPDGFINSNNPLNVFWIDYENHENIRQINVLQKKLAYGYVHKEIDKHTYEISIVSYPEHKMYLVHKDDKSVIVSKFDKEWCRLTNIYVYAEDFGVFPDVKFIELYGTRKNDLPAYLKIQLSE